MDECQVIMGIDEGRKIRAMIERLTGHPCPCTEGRPCVLAPCRRTGAE